MDRVEEAAQFGTGEMAGGRLVAVQLVRVEESAFVVVVEHSGLESGPVKQGAFERQGAERVLKRLFIIGM